MVKEHIKNITKNSALVLALNAVNYASSFILAVLISRYLGVESFGDYSLIFAFVLILGIFSDFGLSTLLIRKLGENKFNAGQVINKFNIIKIFLSAAIISVLFISAYLFFNKIFYTAFFIGILIIIPRSLMSTYESSLRSFQNQIYPVVIKSAGSFLQLAISYLLLIKGSGLTNILLCILITDFITLHLMISANKNVIKKFNSGCDKTEIRSDTIYGTGELVLLLKESSVFFVNNFLMLSIKGLNVILLGYFSSAASVGIYSAGSRFVNGIGLFSGALFNSFYPAISNIKDDVKTKTEITRKFIMYAFVFGLMITIPVYLFPGYLMDLTFKTEESVFVLKILSFTMIPVLIYTITQSFLFTVYKETYLTVILIISWSLNIILSIILIRLYDYTGCAAALAITEVFMMITQLLKFRYDINKPGLHLKTISQ